MDLEQSPVVVEKSICKCCCEIIGENDQFCQYCGFPLNETYERQQKFINNRGYNKEQLKRLETKIAYAAITFYILAGLLLLARLALFFMNTQNDLSVIFLVTDGILAILFFCLGAMSYQYPIAAIFCGLALYVVIIIVGISNGFIINILVLVALSIALVNAYKAQKVRRQNNF